jgi:hypothetical protein
MLSLKKMTAKMEATGRDTVQIMLANKEETINVIPKAPNKAI